MKIINLKMYVLSYRIDSQRDGRVETRVYLGLSEDTSFIDATKEEAEFKNLDQALEHLKTKYGVQ